MIHSSRSASVYLDMHGWGGRGERSLTEIAGELGITHERARQVGLSAANAMAKVADLKLPALGSAVAALQTLAPTLASKADKFLKLKNFTTGATSAGTLIEAARRFGVPCGVHLAQIGGQDFILRPTDEPSIVQCRQIVRKALRATGILDVQAVRTQARMAIARTSLGQPIPEQQRIVEIALSSMPGWSYLDTDRDWATVTIASDGQELHPRGPAARIARMALFYKGIGLRQAQGVLAQQNIHWPSEVLLALCLRMGLRVKPQQGDWLIEVRGEVSRWVERSLAATAEAEMAGHLRRAGGLMSRTRLIALSEEGGLHRSTILACLKSASLFVTTQAGQCMLSNLFELPRAQTDEAGGVALNDALSVAL